jgi:hypothetical protein
MESQSGASRRDQRRRVFLGEPLIVYGGNPAMYRMASRRRRADDVLSSLVAHERGGERDAGKAYEQDDYSNNGAFHY